MRIKKIIIVILVFCMFLTSFGCSKEKDNSSFSIQFIDVGQGDAALVECDGHYMLIDGGDTSAGDKVYEVLKSKDITRLDILAISHLHKDHIGGLIRALSHATTIDLTLCNADYSDKEPFDEFKHQLSINGSKIKIPSMGDKYNLGSAEVEVVDVSAEESNDSLVLLVTYGKTRFLFTGDIEEKAQTRINNKYANDKDEAFQVDLIKMPHHGSYTNTLYTFLRTFMPKNSIISVGAGNKYGHPDNQTLNLLENKELKTKIYRTDKDGDIFVTSNGKSISIKTSK